MKFKKFSVPFFLPALYLKGKMLGTVEINLKPSKPRSRKRDGELCAVTRKARDLDLSPVDFCDPTAKPQPDPRRGNALGGLLRAEKFIEYLRHVFRENPLPGIPYDQKRSFFAPDRLQRHLALGRRVLDRVLKEIGNQTLQESPLPLDPDVLFPCIAKGYLNFLFCPGSLNIKHNTWTKKSMMHHHPFTKGRTRRLSHFCWPRRYCYFLLITSRHG